MNNEVIKAIDIRKSYEHIEVLRGVDVSIRSREIVSIVGKSGAGKSTLLHILGTLDRADQGQLIIDNTDVLKLKDKELANFRNQHIGFVFQFHYLLNEFTALENVTIPGLIQKRPIGEVEQKAKELLDFLGLGDRLHHKPSQMSGGEQQRVAVARALVNNPQVVFADEPSGNLDSQNSEELYKLFFKLRDEMNQSFVIVTHNEYFAQMSDRILNMQDGKIL
ncbi:UNVERIFIED_CONTAM: hypothetical protein GTU68_050042 [Idotea baltica]|nr:hypothetical protein [Idotea baltica]